jgi:hypothetical protein
MPANAAALKKQEERSQATTAEQKAQPVPFPQETKQEVLQQKQREKAIARGEILTPEQRLEALQKLSQNKDAVSSGEQSQFYHLGKDTIMVSNLTGNPNTRYQVLFVKPDSHLTDTHHSITYNADGTFNMMDRDVWTLMKGNLQAGTSRMTKKESTSSLSAEKFGDRLIKQALMLSSKGKSHFSL